MTLWNPKLFSNTYIGLSQQLGELEQMNYRIAGSDDDNKFDYMKKLFFS